MNKYWQWRGLPWQATLLLATVSLILIDIGYLELSFPGLLLGWAAYIWHVTQTRWTPGKTALLSIPLIFTPVVGIWREVHILGVILLVLVIAGIAPIFISRQVTWFHWGFGIACGIWVPVTVFGMLAYVWGAGIVGIFAIVVALWVTHWWKTSTRPAKQEKDGHV